MQIPLKITFHGMEPSEFIEKHLREKVDKLARFSERILGCHVTIEMPHRHQHKGAAYRVNVALTYPKAGIVASRSPEADHSHDDVYVAIRDAFEAVTRQLEHSVGRQRDLGRRSTEGRGAL